MFFRQILKVLSQYSADCRVTMVALRALALLLRSGMNTPKILPATDGTAKALFVI